jgi:hypothetical protein
MTTSIFMITGTIKPFQITPVKLVDYLIINYLAILKILKKNYQESRIKQKK